MKELINSDIGYSVRNVNSISWRLTLSQNVIRQYKRQSEIWLTSNIAANIKFDVNMFSLTRNIL
jgi:hypothetical protein